MVLFYCIMDVFVLFEFFLDEIKNGFCDVLDWIKVVGSFVVFVKLIEFSFYLILVCDVGYVVFFLGEDSV